MHIVWIVWLFVLLVSSPADGFHPLITDDAGTQGKGRFQLELNGEFAHNQEESDTEREDETFFSTTLTYGIIDTADLVLGMTYEYVRLQGDSVGGVAEHEGFSDLSIGVKWRFFEHDGWSLALKGGLALIFFDEERAERGDTEFSLFLITTKEIKPWAFHFNAGYVRNTNDNDVRKDIWHVSLAGEVNVLRDLKAVLNIGAERNPDPSSNDHPAFLLGGLVYSISETLDVDAGVKFGLTKTEADYALLAGMTWRF